MGTKPIFMTTHVKIGPTKPLIHIGIINIGLKAIGAPNTIGSLILNMEGTSDAFPIIFNLCDLAINANMIHNDNVAPPPPIRNKFTASFVKILVTSLPASKFAWFCAIAGKAIALITGYKTQLEIPKVYKNAKPRKLIKTNPQKPCPRLINGEKIELTTLYKLICNSNVKIQPISSITIIGIYVLNQTATKSGMAESSSMNFHLEKRFMIMPTNNPASNAAIIPPVPNEFRSNTI